VGETFEADRGGSLVNRQNSNCSDESREHCFSKHLIHCHLPIAKEKYGGFDAESVRKAALDVDIAPGGTIQGYGVKFFPPGTQLSGQNERSTPVVMQNAGEHISVVYPTNIRTQEPVLPLPKSSVYSM
jgi:branched-chain amino acid transport system substrate-binding protein